MPLLDGEDILTYFTTPLEELYQLPDVLLQDLDRGADWVASLGRGPQPQRRPVIHIPAWDEIIHLVPESWLPEQEQARRRRDRAIRISQSPVPESVQAIGSIMTWIDNTQDALLTAAVLTRIGAVFYKPLLPISTGLGTLAEAINIYGLAANALTTPLTGKARVTRATRGILGAHIVRGLSNRNLQRAMPTVAEAVQIAQTTRDIFGVGLALGPIVGFFQELIFGNLTGAEYAFQSGIRYAPADQLWLRPEYQAQAEALQLHRHLGTLTTGARSAAWILGTRDGPTFDDRLDALALLTVAADVARGFLTTSRWEDLVLPKLSLPEPSSRQIKPATALAIAIATNRRQPAETFPIPGNPPAITPRRQAEELLKCGPECLDRWIPQAPNKASRMFAEQLATDLPFRVLRAIEGPGTGFEVHNTPEWRAVIDSLELGLPPPPAAAKDAIVAYLTQAADLYRQDPTRGIPLRELHQLHRARFPQP